MTVTKTGQEEQQEQQQEQEEEVSHCSLLLAPLGQRSPLFVRVVDCFLRAGGMEAALGVGGVRQQGRLVGMDTVLLPPSLVEQQQEQQLSDDRHVVETAEPCYRLQPRYETIPLSTVLVLLSSFSSMSEALPPPVLRVWFGPFQA